MDSDIQAQEIDELSDIDPVNIPDHELSPSVDDRIARIEDVLHI